MRKFSNINLINCFHNKTKCVVIRLSYKTIYYLGLFCLHGHFSPFDAQIIINIYLYVMHARSKDLFFHVIWGDNSQ